MLNRLFRPLLLLALAGGAPPGLADDSFSIGIIAPALQVPNDDGPLRQAILDTDDDNLAFVVVNGIKSTEENCSDALYLERKILFDAAKNGLIIALAGSDWTACKNTAGSSIAIERLNRLRELFFAEEYSFGSSKIPLARQSNAAKFRSYAENARWEFGPVLFATINLPSSNNHFMPAAGRNSEFEDRLIANRDWLQRLTTIATRRKLAALVLFCDSDLLARTSTTVKRDGFLETREQLLRLAASYPGKILLVHDSARARTGALATIRWSGKVGTLGIDSGWLKLTVTPGASTLFSISQITDTAAAILGPNKKSAAR